MNENINYSFEGDSSGLQKAADDAVGALNAYEQALKASEGQGDFTSIISSIQNTIQGIQNLSSSIGSIPTDILSNMSNLIGNISSNLSYMSGILLGGKGVYAETFTDMQTQVMNMQAAVTQALGPIAALDTEEAKLVSMTDKAAAAENRLSTSSTEVRGAIQKVTQSISSYSQATQKSTKDEKENGDQKQRDIQTWIKIYESIEKVVDKLKGFRSGVSESSSVLNSIGGALSTVNSLMLTLTGIDIASFWKDAVTESVNYIENLNLFNVAMGQSIEYGTKFVNAMQEIYGLDPSNILTYVGNFHQLTSAIEMPTKQADIMSVQLTKLSTDLASLFNMDVNQVVDNMGSGLRGLTRAVAKYGMDIRQTTLQEYAYSLGLTEKVATMSEANREGLRYIAMMKQASRASGDWAKTIESPANQLRILKEQLTQLARALGNVFLPTLEKILPYINGFVMALRQAIQAVAEFFGFVNEDFGGSSSQINDVADGIASIGDKADKTKKKLKSLIAPFDELNVLQDKSQDSGTGQDSEIMDPAIVAAINALQSPLENIQMKANKVRDAILGFFSIKGGALTGVLDKLKSIVGHIRELAGTLKGKFEEALNTNGNGTKIWEALLGILEAILGFIDDIIADTVAWASTLDLSPIIGSFGNLLDAIKNLVKAIGEELKGVYDNVLLPLAKWTIETGLPAAINAIAGALNWFAEHPEVGEIILVIVGAISALIAAAKFAFDAIVALSSVLTALESIAGVLGYETLAELGGAVAAVAPEVAAVIAVVVALIAVIVLVITHLDEIKAWLEKVKEKANEVFTSISDKFQEFFAPFIEKIESIKTKFAEVKKSLVDNFDIIAKKFGEIASTLGQVFSALWGAFKKAVVDPFVEWFSNMYDTYIKPALDVIKNAFNTAFTWIYNKIYKLFDGLVDAVANLFIWCINVVIGLVESMINGIVSAVNLLVAAANTVPGVSIDYISSVKLNRIEYLAQGGVVSGPTAAVIGEGKYDEAVVPLGNSPQMEDMLNRFADKVGSAGPTEVRVYIGDQEWNAFTYKSVRKGRDIVGAQVLGGYSNG